MKMKTKIAIPLTALTIGSLFATPLFVLITQESEKTADAIRAFNKQCAGVDYGADGKHENACRDKREALVGALAKFVILANVELDYFPEDPAKYARNSKHGIPNFSLILVPKVTGKQLPAELIHNCRSNGRTTT